MAGNIIVLAAIVVSGVAVIAQTATFRATTQVVPIYATVRGADGNLLTDLKREDFDILDNGQAQTIELFSSDPVPITAVALWDVSNSMSASAPSMDRLRAAARAFVDAAWPADRIRIGTFGSEIAFSPHLTSDKLLLRRVVDEEIWPGGGSPVWTAIVSAMAHLTRESGRRVLVVLSDGEVAGGARTKEDVDRALQQIDCLVYAIGLEGHGLSSELKSIAEASGGGSRVLKKKASLEKEFTEIVAELHHQYLIGFAPAGLDGSAHALKVQVRLPGATVRARKSYIANTRTPSP